MPNNIRNSVTLSSTNTPQTTGTPYTSPAQGTTPQAKGTEATTGYSQLDRVSSKESCGCNNRPPKSFATRVVNEMTLNWPGNAFMVMVGAGAGAALGSPVLAVAAGIAAPVLMSAHLIRKAEAAYGPGVDANGRR